MSRSVLYSKRIEALQLVSLPAGIVIIIALFLLIGSNKTTGYSVFVGSLVWLAPNLYFALKVFSTGKKKITAQHMLKNFYRAEIIKLALYAVLFIVSLKCLAVAVLPLLIGYSLAQFIFWISPFLLNPVRRLVK